MYSKKITYILLGEISSYKAIVIAKFLSTSYKDVHIIGYDDRKFTKYIRTKYCSEIKSIVSIKTDKQAHLNNIATIIREKEIDLFIPVDSGAYGDYIKSKDIFGNAFSYVGEYKTYEQLHDKARFSILASSLGLRVPESYPNLKEAKIPFVTKPINLSSAKGVEYVFSEKKRNKICLNTNSEYIFQEYISGIGCGYSVFAKDGKIINGHGHMRLAEYPVTGGSSVYRTSYENQQMKKIAEKLLSATRWSGFAMIEFKLLPTKELVLIEVNPRIWGSINQGLQNGANYFESLLGVSSYSSSKAKLTYLSPLFYQAIINYLIRLQFRPLLLFIKNIIHNTTDISIFKDFKGYISTILRKIL